MVKSVGDHLNYEWLIEGRKILKSDERFKDINTDTLKIESFENKYRGVYTCVISTICEQKISMSVNVKLNFQSK